MGNAGMHNDCGRGIMGTTKEMLNLTSLINYTLVMDIGLYVMLAIALIALYYDLTYKPQVYDLVALLDRRISNSAPKTDKKLRVTFTPIFAARDHSLEAEAKNVKELYSNSEYKAPKGFVKETYTGGLIKAEFTQPEKSTKVSYRLPVQRLTLKESRKLEIGSVELERVKA